MNPQQYRTALVTLGADMPKIVNWFAHYLYGTSATTLAKLSKIGFVYNPPGHQ